MRKRQHLDWGPISRRLSPKTYSSVLLGEFGDVDQGVACRCGDPTAHPVHRLWICERSQISLRLTINEYMDKSNRIGRYGKRRLVIETMSHQETGPSQIWNFFVLSRLVSLNILRNDIELNLEGLARPSILVCCVVADIIRVPLKIRSCGEASLLWYAVKV